ncbi:MULTISPECIES: TPR end-of-group domain-containing protein [Leptospira]|uniref:TPR end-of-group domain-containing protein n=1 Tax=Leptospira TaxID=171 RepID=UPI0002BDAAF9|nr:MULTISPECIES: hypothetical protein [Leptospira]EMK09235.1 hypothetical protein LEP1GSC166_3198 [Leptospira kirschneri]KXZ25425.1 anaphase-promoting complex subunit 5 domain protein [Leptospira kirschneri]KXZ28337.1 anaphase-promoting complex subunit 5 domain protein [Leptospira sp. ZV016]
MIFRPKDFPKKTIPKYYSDYFEKLNHFDFEGAIKLLEKIFHDERNQNQKGKPTDFLNEKKKYKSLSVRFQEMLDGFHFSEPLSKKVDLVLKHLEESFNPENLRVHRFKPFNGFLFKMSDDGFSSAVLESIHFDPETQRISNVFGLNHEIIFEKDSYPSGEDLEETEENSSELYDFIYDMEEGEYSIYYQEEKIDGRDLHVHIKLLLFTKMIREIVDKLLLDERFAKFPKVFPFYVLVNSEECYNYTQDSFFLEILPPIELQSIRENPYFTLYETSSKIENSISAKEEFLFHLKFLDQQDSKEFQTLLKIVNSNPEFQSILEKSALDSLNYNFDEQDLLARVKDFEPHLFSSFFWKLAQFNPKSHLENARNFQNKVFFRLPPPLVDSYKIAIPNINDFSYVLFHSYLSIPEEYKSEFYSSFEETLNRMKSLAHPGFKIRAMEIEARFKSNQFDSKESPIYSNPPEEFIDVIIDLIHCMPKRFPWFGEAWDFVFKDRLLPLGKKAKRAVPAVIEVMERYNYEDSTRELATILYNIGCDDIPSLVHELHKENEFYMEEFYDQWSKQAPVVRWSYFLDRFEHFPEDFARSEIWEDLLYDSEPGFLVYYENIEKDINRNRIFYALLKALKNDPQDVPSRFALFYAEKLRNKAKKNRESFFQIISEMTEILKLLNVHGKLNSGQRVYLECGIAAKSIQAFLLEKTDVLDILNETLSEISINPLLLFLKVNYIEKKEGIKRGMEELRQILPVLWKDDFILSKAFFLYLLFPDQNWDEIPSGKLYAFYTKVRSVFQNHFFRDGNFVTDLESFDMDLFIDVLKKEYSKLEIESHKVWVQNQAEEYLVFEKLGSISEKELATFLKPGNLSLNLSIASKLLRSSKNFSKELLQLLEWETEKNSVFQILKLYYPNEFLKEELLQNSVFHTHLSFFIREYDEVSSRELAKFIFSKLQEKQNSLVIVETVKDLDPDAIIYCFLTVYWAFQNENRLNEFESILIQFLKDSDQTRPEYVLIATNLGVLQIEIGKLETAKTTFDSIFSMDWSRFDYKKESDFMDKILGDDLDKQYSDIFRKYYAHAKFNAACLYSKLQDPEKSVSYLKEAAGLEPEIYNRTKILSEKDFLSIEHHEIYKEFINSLN